MTQLFLFFLSFSSWWVSGMGMKPCSTTCKPAPRPCHIPCHYWAGCKLIHPIWASTYRPPSRPCPCAPKFKTTEKCCTEVKADGTCAPTCTPPLVCHKMIVVPATTCCEGQSPSHARHHFPGYCGPTTTTCRTTTTTCPCTALWRQMMQQCHHHRPPIGGPPPETRALPEKRKGRPVVNQHKSTHAATRTTCRAEVESQATHNGEYERTPEEELARETATKGELASETATKEEPASETATKEEPASETATKEEPASETATKEEPASETATKDETASETATKGELASETATKEGEKPSKKEPATQVSRKGEQPTEKASPGEQKSGTNSMEEQSTKTSSMYFHKEKSLARRERLSGPAPSLQENPKQTVKPSPAEQAQSKTVFKKNDEKERDCCTRPPAFLDPYMLGKLKRPFDNPQLVHEDRTWFSPYLRRPTTRRYDYLGCMTMIPPYLLGRLKHPFENPCLCNVSPAEGKFPACWYKPPAQNGGRNIRYVGNGNGDSTELPTTQ